MHMIGSASAFGGDRERFSEKLIFKLIPKAGITGQR